MMIGLGFVTISNHLVRTLDAVLIAVIESSKGQISVIDCFC